MSSARASRAVDVLEAYLLGAVLASLLLGALLGVSVARVVWP